MPLSPFLLGAVVLTVAAIGGWAVGAEAGSSDQQAREFIQRHETVVRPLEIEAGRASWAANLDGTDENYRKKEELETRLDLLLADPGAFARLKGVHERPPADPLLRREIEVLYRDYLSKQLDPELLKKILAESNFVERTFNVFRPVVDGKELTDNEVRRVLIESKDSARRRAVWEASKAVGRQVAGRLKELVKLRNQSARKLGFKDFHVMQLYLNEQDQREVLALFDQLDALTRQAFRDMKAELGRRLGEALRHHGGGASPLALSGPVLPGAARGV